MLTNIVVPHAALWRALGMLMLPVVLSGCNLQLFNPAGAIGVQEKNLIIVASVLMLLVVIPVIALTLYFAWRYRASNTAATYSPQWSHSTRIEIVVWTIPCVIVLILGVMIWRTTHALDPYRPLESDVPPLHVEVVAMNWKWLFIYPDYGVASVSELRIPVGTPVEFKLTADSIMNSFFVPRLGSMVYAMPGMQTKVHLLASEPGLFRGMSAAYSGSGFSDMRFDTVASSRAEFDGWVAAARKDAPRLDRASYAALAQASHGYPVTTYGSVAPGMFAGVVDKYMFMDALAALAAAEWCAPTAAQSLAVASPLPFKKEE